MRALATGGYYIMHWLREAITYLLGRIAGEVAVFDRQDPVVDDRSAVLCK